MRILITVGHYHPDHPSGSSRIAYEEARFLASAGSDTWILGQKASANDPEYALDNGVHVLRYSVPRMSRLDPRRAWRHQFRVKAGLRKYLPQVDVVHGHSPLAYDAACDVYGANPDRFYTVHSPARLELSLAWSDGTFGGRLRSLMGLPWIERLERRCLLRSTGVTVLSEFTFNLISTLYGAGITEHVRVIPGWVDLDRFQISYDRSGLKKQLGWPTDVPVFFTLRRLVPRMGLDTLLRALKRVIEEGQTVLLLIGGSGPLRADLERLAWELNIAPFCRFLGRVPDEDLPAMYAACDAFVLPTAHLECFGLIMLEALACGRPVLATPVGAIPEIVEQVEAAWLAENGSELAFAQLLYSFLKGLLPSHSPEQLRALVSRRYAKHDQLARMGSFLLSQDYAQC